MNRHHLLGLSMLIGLGVMGAIASPVGLELFVLLTLLLVLVLERLLLDRAEVPMRSRVQLLLILGLMGLVVIVANRVRLVLEP